MQKNVVLFGLIFLIFLAVINGTTFYSSRFPEKLLALVHNRDYSVGISEKIRSVYSQTDGVARFTSVEEFRHYLSRSLITYSQVERLGGADSLAIPIKYTTDTMNVLGSSLSKNMQIFSSDKPNVIKSDAKSIYFSPEQPQDVNLPEISSVDSQTPFLRSSNSIKSTSLLSAFPPEILTVQSKIPHSGELFLYEKMLIVLSQDGIYGYDITNTAFPVEKWQILFNDYYQLSTARLYGDRLYLITSRSINRIDPCPIIPYKQGTVDVTVLCKDIYYPRNSVPVDTTYVVSDISVHDGSTKKITSFVGSYAHTLSYISENAVYFTYSYYGDIVNFLMDFFIENNDFFAKDILQNLLRLREYDLHDGTKIVEMEEIIAKYIFMLPHDEQFYFKQEFDNRMERYISSKQRELKKTGIIKIDRENFNKVSHGIVPGIPLNQSSFNVYNGTVRIVTTISGDLPTSFSIPFKSTNDIYILGDDLSLLGSLEDFGRGEKVHAVHFFEELGYVSQPRETGLSYLLDLSNRQRPMRAGELDIPGGLSYFYLISQNTVLSISAKDKQVKLSLFDISDVQNPRKQSEYLLDDSWSNIRNVHNAFLLDSQYKIFFIPGLRGGSIFSYEDNKIVLKKVINIASVKHSLLINNFLYIIGDQKIIALDKNTWERAGELKFLDPSRRISE